jgi:lipopolysaccharide/colanic/teichoic acid biosynthesis glycosyltransferase
VGVVATRWINVGRTKRLLDLCVAVPALVVLAPVYVVVAAMVRLKFGTPVLFRQERAGQAARPISVPKFRSMTDRRSPDGELLPDEERMTPFSRKLRASSLDELPQLWTVVSGEMSLVGPRPLPTAYVERYSPEQRRRLEAKPGITGWAQVNGRNSTSWPERLGLDVWYVDNASFRLDLKILALTARTAISRHGVAAEGHVTMHEFTGET